MGKNSTINLDVTPFLGTQVFMCPVCNNTRSTNLVAPKCKQCKAPLELVEYDPEPKWDFNGQEIFLTYPKTPGVMDPNWLLTALNEKFFMHTNNVHEYIITRELHEDGGYHLHAYVRFEKRFRTQNRNFFTVNPKYSEERRPHWQRVRGNKHKLFAYVKKDGTWNGNTGYITNFDPRPRVLQLVEDTKTMKEFWEQLAYVSEGYWRVKAAVELKKELRFERYGCGQYHKWVTTSETGYMVCATCKAVINVDDILKKSLGGNSK